MISNETFPFAALGEHQGCDDLLADAISRGREYGCVGAVNVSRDCQVHYTWGNELFSSFSFIMSYSKYLFGDNFFFCSGFLGRRQAEMNSVWSRKSKPGNPDCGGGQWLLCVQKTCFLWVCGGIASSFSFSGCGVVEFWPRNVSKV